MPRCLVLAGLALALVLPATAGAASVSGGEWLVYAAAPGEANNVTVTFSDGLYTVRDTGAALDAGFDCTPIDAHAASCPGSGTAMDPARISLGDGDDTLHADDAPDVIDGGDGNDEIHGGAGADRITGGPGNDLLDGGGGDPVGRYYSAEVGTPQPTPDILDGGPGADVLQGGGGAFDEADYSDRTADVSVTLDNIANDGEAGEGDNVETDVEDVRTGSGNDVLSGDSYGNTLDGGSGNDLIVGGGGYQDVAEGGDGNDVLKLLDGGLEGLKGIDGPIPGFKFDDIARCDAWTPPSAGDDIAFVDPTDAGQAGQLGTADPPCEHVFMSASPQSLPVADGNLTLPVACGAGQAAATCNGTAVVRLPKRVAAAASRRPALGRRIAAKHFRARYGKRGKLRVKLTRKARRAIGPHRRARVWVEYSYARR